MKSTFPVHGHAVVWTLLLAFALAAATVGGASAQSTPLASAPAQECRRVKSFGTGFLEQCGDRLDAWRLIMPQSRREMGSDLHGRIFFRCAVELMCGGEPTIVGRFVNRAEWQNSARDERAMFELADDLRVPPRPLPPMPPLDCPLFDISLAGMAGKAVCFGESGLNGSSVVVVAADDRVVFVLSFYQQDKSAEALKEKVVLEMLPRFKMERATGDAALLKWFR